MQRIVVIGAQGQLGSALLSLARAGGIEAIAAGRRGGADLEVDLERPASLEPVFALNADAVFVTAAFTAVDRCEDEPARAEQVNVRAPELIARRAKGRVVYFSTDYVFDGEAPSYTERDAPAPLNVYGRTKLEGERAVLGCADGNLAIRTSWLFGPDPNQRNFVYQLLQAARDGRALKAASDQVACPTYTVDLARAALDLVRHGASGLFHAAGPTSYSRAAFAELIARRLALDPRCIEPVRTAALQQKAKRPLSGVLDCTKLAGVIGRSLRSPEQTLQEMKP